MTQRWTVVGFTGHRKLADASAAARGIAAALDAIDPGPDGSLAAVSSAASGADTLFLEAAAARGLPRHVILPFAVERFEQDFAEEPGAWARVKPLIDSAGCVEVVQGAADRKQAYLENGVRTVEEADVLIAVWDQRPAKGTGGTGDIVAFAQALGKRVLVVGPDTGAIDDRPATEAPEPGEYQQDIDRPPPTAALAQVDARYDEHSALAEQHAPRARLLTLRIINLHLIASAVAIIGLVVAVKAPDLHWPGFVFGGIKVFALCWALVLVYWHHHAQHAWVAHRPRAELVRSFQAMWRLSRSHAMLPDTPLPQLEDLRRDMRLRWMHDRDAPIDLEQAKTIYLNDRIRHQRGYFVKHGRLAARRYTWIRRSAHTITALAIASGVLVLVLMGGAELHLAVSKKSLPLTYAVLKCASVILPLVVAAVLSLVIALDMGRRVVRYKEMAARLKLHHRAVAAAPSWPALWRAVHVVEAELLKEIDEWRTVTRLAGEAH